MTTGTELDYFKRGGVNYPLVSATTNSLLQDGDPFVYGLLDFLAAMIRKHLGERFVAECAAANYRDPAGVVFANVVGETLPTNPVPYLGQAQFVFPLVCAWRTRGMRKKLTAQRGHALVQVQIAYVLPPADVAIARGIVAPLLAMMGDVIDDRTSLAADSTYTPPFTGAAAGDKYSDWAGIEQFQILSDEVGRLPGADGNLFPAYLATGEVRIRSMSPDDVYQPLDGVDASLTVPGDPDTVPTPYEVVALDLSTSD